MGSLQNRSDLNGQSPTQCWGPAQCTKPARCSECLCSALRACVEAGQGIGGGTLGGVSFALYPTTGWPVPPLHSSGPLECSDMSHLRTADSPRSRLTDTAHYWEVALIILDFGEKSPLSFFSCKSFTIKVLLCHCSCLWVFPHHRTQFQGICSCTAGYVQAVLRAPTWAPANLLAHGQSRPTRQNISAYGNSYSSLTFPKE